MRAAEPLGFSPALWRALAGIGAPGIAVAGNRGGGGFGFFAASLAAEVLGRALAPVPFAEHVVATRLLSRFAAADAASASDVGALGPLVSGASIATLALRPTERGLARLVPAGAIADVLVALDGDELVRIDVAPPGRALPNLAASPLADRSVAAGDENGARRTSLARGAAALAAFERARAEWRALTSAALVGLAQGAFDLGLAYVKERQQFGVPIGSFQAIQHALADLAVGIEGARLLARKAAWAIGEQEDAECGDRSAEPARAPAPLAAMSLQFSAELAQSCAYRSLHHHGGNGVSEEYDIQLYYRRAKGWPLVLGTSSSELAHLADAMFGARQSAGGA